MNGRAKNHLMSTSMMILIKLKKRTEIGEGKNVYLLLAERKFTI